MQFELRRERPFLGVINQVPHKPGLKFQIYDEEGLYIQVQTKKRKERR